VPRPGISGRGRYLLRRIALASGTVRDGPSFAGDGITLASGYLWIYRGPDQGQGSRPGSAVVRQVSPRTLTVLRSVTLAPPGPVTHVSVAGGPAGSVWIGDSRAAWRVSTATGAVLAQVTVPAGFAVRDVAVDPGRRYLYVSVLNVGPQGGPWAVFEYDAAAGHLLASAERGPVTFALAGADLTATPSGVWASYRTGMLGATILLRRRGLATVLPPGYGRGPRQKPGVCRQ